MRYIEVDATLRYLGFKEKTISYDLDVPQDFELWSKKEQLEYVNKDFKGNMTYKLTYELESEDI